MQPVVVISELLDQHPPPGRVQQVLEETGQKGSGILPGDSLEKQAAITDSKHVNPILHRPKATGQMAPSPTHPPRLHTGPGLD